jgi:hypothetical protein
MLHTSIVRSLFFWLDCALRYAFYIKRVVIRGCRIVASWFVQTACESPKSKLQTIVVQDVRYSSLIWESDTIGILALMHGGPTGRVFCGSS